MAASQKLADRLLKACGVKLHLTGERLARESENTAIVYHANHQSWLDILIMKKLATGKLVARGDLARHPVIGPLTKAFPVIFVEKDQQGKYMPAVPHAFEDTINAGDNLIVFPEARTSSGAEVLPINHGALSVPFNEGAGGRLKRNVTLQPMVITPVRANGQTLPNEKMREIYGWYKEGDGILSNAWRKTRLKSLEVEVNVLPAMDTRDFESGDEIMQVVTGELAHNINRPAPLRMW